jgi:hypothetical protein
VKLAFSTTIKPYHCPWLQPILQLASNIIQEARAETNSLLLKARGVLNKGTETLTNTERDTLPKIQYLLVELVLKVLTCKPNFAQEKI